MTCMWLDQLFHLRVTSSSKIQVGRKSCLLANDSSVAFIENEFGGFSPFSMAPLATSQESLS